VSVNKVADVKSGDTVVPGDTLCVIEEFSAGHGTYESGGIVYAATAGGVSFDLKERSIQVLTYDKKSKLSLPVEGDIMIGEVTSVYDQRALISIVKHNDKNLFSPLEGEVHISNVTRRFVKSMHDVLAPMDIVRAVAMNTHEIPVELSLVGSDFGVLFAKCTKCGNPLTVTVRNHMICLRCDYRTTREVTDDYGLMFGLEPRQDLAPRRRSYDRRGSDRRGGRRYDKRDNHRRGSRRQSSSRRRD
jgi:exosome complex component CSL4